MYFGALSTRPSSLPPAQHPRKIFHHGCASGHSLTHSVIARIPSLTILFHGIFLPLRHSKLCCVGCHSDLMYTKKVLKEQSVCKVSGGLSINIYLRCGRTVRVVTCFLFPFSGLAKGNGVYFRYCWCSVFFYSRKVVMSATTVCWVPQGRTWWQ